MKVLKNRKSDFSSLLEEKNNLLIMQNSLYIAVNLDINLYQL